MTTNTFPEFDVEDFTRLRIDQIPAHRVNEYIDHCLQDKEFRDLTMNHYGSYILGASKNLLNRSSALLCDLGALSGFIDPPESEPIDWAALKRQERANNLKLWWEKKRKRSELMRSISRLHSKGKGTETEVEDTAVIAEIAKDHSPGSRKCREFAKELKDLTPGAQIPYRHIITRQVKDGTNQFSDLIPITENKRKDKALQFQYIVELQHNGYIQAEQNQAFGDIHLSPKRNMDPYIKLKDQTGNRTTIDWYKTSKIKRNIALTYLNEGKVIMEINNW